MKRYRCIIFDLDGTLGRTNQLIFDAFNHVTEKYTATRLTTQEIIAYFGPPEEVVVQQMVGTERFSPAMEDYYRFYTQEHGRLAYMFPGVEGLLQYLRSKGVLLALFTGKGRRTTDITLGTFGIGEYFDVTMTGDDVGEWKPSGDGIRRILQKLGIPPQETLMVGDAVSDVSAARETGVDVASVVWDSYGKAEVMKLGADHLFHDIGEFIQWLKVMYGV